ncbi:sugar O-acyltransferase, sialic acid O-acetyltransferase NeuD family [Catalinimonas alkaloidigena]|uniref:Sugar O-acyltransferase, sialic acid O-acetyltransferase NeuD family n=1 Tax=Catalinimonas alkaloidigena TaxID=1075417 RepID=A0A1G9N456_9BACT|nr:acetyltransferase [Catalinimonas alkaloidigena]SDL80635.1 sugar O-acyltransferase, sialic acid O-acetyltransferase NeuD family [Catalinimonas alkaloidigena]
MEKPVIIFGASGLGKVALEIFESNGIVIYGFLDDDKALHGQQIGEVSVLGKTDDAGFLKLIGHKCEAFVAVDDNALRKGLVKMLNDKRHVMPTNAIHQRAYVAPSAYLGHGNLLSVGTTLNAFAKVGQHCILHANATLDYEVELGDFVQVGAGSTIGAGAKLENEVFVGAGAVILPGVTVGKGARIGAGSVVLADVAAKETVLGNPAQPFKR